MLYFLGLMLISQIDVQHAQKTEGVLLNGVACNASASARTAVISDNLLLNKGMIGIGVQFTRVAATEVQMACSTRFDSQGTLYAAQYCDTFTAGVCNSVNASFKKAVSSSANWIWRFDFLSASNLSCVFSCTGGGASDLITVTARSSSL